MAAKILIIEDESGAAKNIAKALKTEGFEIAGIVNDCIKATDMVNSDSPDLVICNLYLKFSKGGQNLVSAIRAIRDIPFVFLSAFAHDLRLNKILQTNSEIYLSGPFESKILVKSVNRLLNVQNLQSSHS